MGIGSDRTARHHRRVAKIGRNEPCPCGSGRKAKRCCGIERGPSEESLARAFLSGAARQAAEWTSHLSDAGFDALLDELWELPARDLSLQVELPKFFPPSSSASARRSRTTTPTRICSTRPPDGSTARRSAPASPAPCSRRPRHG